MWVNDATLTYAHIAQRFKSTEVAVRTYASRHNWQVLRDKRSSELLQRATQKSINVAATELAKYNEVDIQVAKMGRSFAATRLQKGMKPDLDEDGNPLPGQEVSNKDIRMLMGAIESAQRVARLALGATTEHVLSSDAAELEDFSVESYTLDELDAFKQLLSKGRTNGRHEADRAAVDAVQ
jgi:hypothetical protein